MTGLGDAVDCLVDALQRAHLRGDEIGARRLHCLLQRVEHEVEHEHLIDLGYASSTLQVSGPSLGWLLAFDEEIRATRGARGLQIPNVHEVGA
jgi:hypothetical protein